ncbi:MAG TPA: hypothetical protein ENK74_01055 [Nitratifractor sp.]|nr:hypothetical protein [Nitratifractor sp.]
MKKLLIVISFLLLTVVHAQEAEIGPKNILQTLQNFYAKFKGGDELLKKANGYLVFPTVYKAGLVVGGEYGVGALIEQGSITDYYRMVSTSIGLQVGAQKRSLIILFMTKEALENFKNKEQWKVGVDGMIAVMNWSTGTDLSSVDIKKNTFAIAFNDIGVMANLTLEGTVFQRSK